MPLINKSRSIPGRTGGDAASSAHAGSGRLRLALTAFFALDGFLFAGWVVRIPAVKSLTHASNGELGLALLGVSAGAVATMMLTGRLCGRFGNHPVTVASGALISVGVALPPLTRSPLSLGLVLLVFGSAYGAINVAMNSAAVDLVAALRRPVMPGFHAAFSLGGMLGAGLGGLVAGSLGAAEHLAALSAVGLLVTVLAGRALLSHPAPPSARDAGPSGAAAAGRTAHRRGVVLVLGMIALCTAYGEGALADWSALHLTETLNASPGVAAAGYSAFALAMTAGRLGGTALLERFGQARSLVAGGLAAAAGMLLGSLAPDAAWALAGFALTGLGLANIFPVAIGRAGALAGPRGVAAASTLGYGGMLVGPVVIGFVAERTSLPGALSTVAALAALAAALAGAARRTL
ncbi:MFS transporter [Streptomyces sp. TR06-5]|uniref:MFS transporter n=1 Tax=unclassified Streptomyces TaxID=2593676 RepID=UPI0039A3412A